MITEAQVYATIPVTNMKKATAFYGDKLGFKAVMESGDAATLYSTISGGTFLVFKANSASNGEHTLMSLQVEDIEAQVTELKGKGVTFKEYDMEIKGVGPIKTVNSIAETGPVRTAWFTDPEGNLISVTQLIE